MDCQYATHILSILLLYLNALSPKDILPVWVSHAIQLIRNIIQIYPEVHRRESNPLRQGKGDTLLVFIKTNKLQDIFHLVIEIVDNWVSLVIDVVHLPVVFKGLTNVSAQRAVMHNAIFFVSVIQGGQSISKVCKFESLQIALPGIYLISQLCVHRQFQP